MGKIDGIMKAVAATPWAILPEKLEAILDVLDMRADGLRFTREEIEARIGSGMKGAPVASVQGAIAVLPLSGVIAPRMNMMTDVSGGTSTEQFGREFDAAIANPNVSAIVIDADSPGGSAIGITELAAKVRAGRDIKPVYAVVNHMSASAAYAITAQATQIIASPSSLTGSIGVFMTHTDDTEADAKAGVRRTVVSAGKYKAEGHGSLTDDARGAIQATVDEFYAMFLSDVAKGRGVSVATVRGGYGEGRTLPAKQALAAGLIDRVATMEDVLGELASSAPPTKQRLRADAEPLKIAASVGGDFTSGVTLSENDGVLTLSGDAWTWHNSNTADATNRLTLGSATQGSRFVLLPAKAPAEAPTSLSAPQAKEQPVSDTPTVVPGATTAELAIVQAEISRRETIGQLCQLAGASLSDMNGFIASGKTADAVRAELATRVKPATPTPSITGMVDREAMRPFASLGEQLKAIANHGENKGTDKRLLQINAALSSGAASANVPSDGAFQIQQDFSVDLTKDAFGEGTLAGDCSKTEVSGTSDGLRVMYIDETSRATGSRWGGVRVYRGKEGDLSDPSKPTFGEWERRVYDMIGAAKISERLLDDAPAMASVLSESFSTEFAFAIDDEIVRGTGAGQCLGLVNSPALVTVAKESGQVADTVVAENIMKMWARLLPRAKATAKWYINQEIEQQLQTMQIGTGASGQLVYMPPGGLSGVGYGTIYGRPVQIVEQCSAPGDVGDIILASLPGYKLITKGGLQSDDSIHVAFLAHERTFRWLTRVGGAPKLKSALTPYKGAATLSDHVTLAAR